MTGLRSILSCEICGNTAVLPVNRPWDFRLNGFLCEALKEHGLISLIWCLGKLQQAARSSFFFFGPHDLFDDYPEDRFTAAKNKADLSCVVDGKTYRCEVKSSCRDIDISTLAKVAARITPDYVLLAVMDYKSPRLQQKYEELRKLLSISNIDCELMVMDTEITEPKAYLPYEL